MTRALGTGTDDLGWSDTTLYGTTKFYKTSLPQRTPLSPFASIRREPLGR